MDFGNLNKQQIEAVKHIDGPLLILAGAGSGKTSTMTHRIAYLIERGVKPWSILAVTFTNKAAQEMRDRVEVLVGSTRGMWIMTFHALCLRMLREHAEKVGYPKDFVIYDTTDQKTIARNIIKELNLDPKQYKAAYILSVISDRKEQGITPRQFEEQSGTDIKSRALVNAYYMYEKTLKDNGAMDFDDLLLNAVKLLKSDEAVLMDYQERFEYIMVDEYQDTNHIQYELVHLLARRHQNICVVGDDDQCIYQWRGADIRNILDFEKDFPKAKVIKLEQNYRSKANILTAAHSVIENNRSRKSKKLWTEAEAGEKITYYRAEDEKDEARFVAGEIELLMHKAWEDMGAGTAMQGAGSAGSAMRGDAGAAGSAAESDSANKPVVMRRKYSDFAILYRTNAQSRQFEEALTRKDIPYRVLSGLRYYDRKEIKDIMAYMRLVVNPKDDLSLRRIINEPKRGIGEKTLDKIQALAAVRGESMFEALSSPEVIQNLPGKASIAVKEMVDAIQACRDEEDNLLVSDIYDQLLVRTGYLAALENENTVESEGRIENLMEFKTVVMDYEQEAAMEALRERMESADAEPLAGIDIDRSNGAQAWATGIPSAEPVSGPSLSGFMEKLSLMAEVDNHDENEDAVVLMTMHSSKGLEFPVVFLPGMEDGLFPGHRSMDSPEGLEEERRLCYVGMTRAKERLFLTGAAMRTMYGRTDYTRESQFLRELDKRVMTGDAIFERRTDFGMGRVAGPGVYTGSVDGAASASMSGYKPYDAMRSGRDYSASGGFGTGRDYGAAGGFGTGKVYDVLKQAREATKKSVRDAAGSASESYQAGDQVVHKKFGIGTVVASTGSSVTVDFGGDVGEKKLAKGMAPIKKL